MLANSSESTESFQSSLKELARLRRFSGSPQEFWPAYLAACAKAVGAARGMLIVRDSSQQGRLKKLGDWSDNGQADRTASAFNRVLQELTEKCVTQGRWYQALEGGLGESIQSFAIGISLQLDSASEKCVAAFLLANTTERQAAEALMRLQFAADLPLNYQANQSAVQSKVDVEKFASVLDIMVLVNAETRFLAAALAFCNGLASRFQCERVSLGWLEGGYVRLQAMSHTERFDKKMAAVQSLELAMEEALDQDQEIVWPPANGDSAISRDHGKFGHDQQVANVCSLPLRLGDKPMAVLTCERQAKAFTPAELQQLRLACDQAAPRLSEVRGADRWFGARLAGYAQEKFAGLLGPEHTWMKVAAVGGALALVVMLLPIFPYRVEGNFILKAGQVSFLTAPFDGYIRSVETRPGDLATNGAPLLRLKTDDLKLEEAGAAADQKRYQREAEKARAGNQLAEMRIAQALADQAEARLNLLRYRLDQAVIHSPFDGVVIEGDLQQRIGAPIKKGDALFRVARLDLLYMEAEVNERDIHEVMNKAAGEIAFVTQPRLKFPIKIVRFESAAIPKEGKNVFLVRGAFEQKPENWWRPGMSGICKINVENRTLLWILTHRTIDFLRMFFWW